MIFIEESHASRMLEMFKWVIGSLNIAYGHGILSTFSIMGSPHL
jgi:hypothetical protein